MLPNNLVRIRHTNNFPAALNLVDAEIKALLKLLDPILEPIESFAESTIKLAGTEVYPVLTKLQSVLATVEDDVANAVGL